MAKLTITITKTDKEKFTVKCGTSVGGGQQKCKDKSLDEVKDFLGNIIQSLDENDCIGRK